MIITIDGPAGTGKSTVAKKLAAQLGFLHFDSGALFRSIAWGVIAENIDPTDEIAILKHLEKNPINASLTTPQNFFFGNTEVTALIRTQEIGSMASKISTWPRVREYVKELERALAGHLNAVFDGRDMGTVIFPDAQCKIFLTASPEVRAHRRLLELQEKGLSASFEDVLQEIIERDERDSTREHAPLRPASDAHIIDTSTLSIDAVIYEIVKSLT